MLRKMLGIYDMLNVEIREDYESRVHFNNPYSDIRVKIGDIGKVIPELNADKKHLLWLDYDDVLQEYMAGHITDALTILPPGSIIVLTVDIEFNALDNASNKTWFQHLEHEVSAYLPPGLSPFDCGSSELHTTTISILRNIITRVLSHRSGVDFRLLFNFIYADGHKMLTIGGIIAGREDKRILRSCDWNRFPFSRQNFDQMPFVIRVPTLTRRERFYLDSHMPRVENWSPECFQLQEAELAAYNEIFKYCPLYGELLL